MVSRRTASACSMRRSDHPRRPSARICCCLVSSKTLLMPVTELAFRPDVNVSIATGNGRFSAVDQWPVLSVHRGNDFFALFERFSGYVNFFLLQDLVTDDYAAVRFFMP